MVLPPPTPPRSSLPPPPPSSVLFCSLFSMKSHWIHEASFLSCLLQWHGITAGGDRERIEGAEGVWDSIGRTTKSTNQTPQSSQGVNYQPKSTHGATHGSSHICSRGWPCWTSMGGPWSFEVLMSKCRGMPGPGSRSGWVGEQGEREWDRGFLEEETRKGNNIWNVNKENI